MGRREADGRSDVEKFRKNIGKQEFKGKNKKRTLSIRDKAQSRKSTGTTIKHICLIEENSRKRSREKTSEVKEIPAKKEKTQPSLAENNKIVVLYLLVILAVLVSIYLVFYTVYTNNKEMPHSN